MWLRILIPGWIAAAVAAAQMQPAPVSVEPVRGGIYLVRGGSGANTAFIVGKDEVVAIDAKMSADSARAMLAGIAKVTTLPVKHIILTHSDGDHVNGLSGFPKGITIVAHANTKKDMEEAFRDPKLADLAAYLPSEVVTQDRLLELPGIKLRLLYFGPAHTSGDLVVYLPEQKVAIIGDLAFVGRDPLIHRQKGGTSFGLIQVLRKISALDADTFLTGHSDPLTKADLEKLAASIGEKQSKVKALIEQGKTLDEIKAALGVTDTAGSKGVRRPSFIEVIYQEMSTPQRP